MGTGPEACIAYVNGLIQAYSWPGYLLSAEVCRDPEPLLLGFWDDPLLKLILVMVCRAPEGLF